jgi:predicted metalloprotease with PDZ domain
MFVAKPLALTSFLLLTSAAMAEISYTVTPQPTAGAIRVKISFPVKGTETKLQIPRWLPGYYVIQDFAGRLKEVAAKDGSGADVTIEKLDDITWKLSGIKGGKVDVTYLAPSRNQEGTMTWKGAAEYMYVVDRKTEKCRLKIEAPEGWKVAIGLDEVKGKPFEYTASDYDVLADNPVTAGNYIEERYTVLGKPHILAIYGPARNDVDRPKLLDMCKQITEIEADYFKGLPYNKYVWHFHVMNSFGGSGLEHLSSTEITLSSALGPGMAGLLAHELFHLWNVKRIRSKVLGPFDYTTMPKTGALWWLEGVTDYFAQTLLSRYQFQEPTMMYADVLDNHRSLRGNPRRLEVSPYDSGARVGEAANGRGNSMGLGISYYTAGFLLGFVFDVEILEKTGGKRSLDDVQWALWDQAKRGGPGFEETELRKQLVKAGGESVGALYDQYVMKPGDLPVEAALAKVGLQIVDAEETLPVLGFMATPVSAERGLRVTRGNDLLKEGTIIREVQGVRVEGETAAAINRLYRSAIEKVKPGDDLVVKIVTDSGEQAVTLKVGERKRTVQRIVDVPNASPAALELRKKWMAKKR